MCVVRLFYVVAHLFLNCPDDNLIDCRDFCSPIMRVSGCLLCIIFYFIIYSSIDDSMHQLISRTTHKNRVFLFNMKQKEKEKKFVIDLLTCGWQLFHKFIITNKKKKKLVETIRSTMCLSRHWIDFGIQTRDQKKKNVKPTRRREKCWKNQPF